MTRAVITPTGARTEPGYWLQVASDLWGQGPAQRVAAQYAIALHHATAGRPHYIRLMLDAYERT